MRVLWARKLERYHDLMSFRRRRFLFSYIFFLQRPSLYLLSAPERRMNDGAFYQYRLKNRNSLK
jgi:hypothetical protein